MLAVEEEDAVGETLGVGEAVSDAPAEKVGVGVAVGEVEGVAEGVPLAAANSAPTEKSMPQAAGVVTRTVYTQVGDSTAAETSSGEPQVKYTSVLRRGFVPHVSPLLKSMAP